MSFLNSAFGKKSENLIVIYQKKVLYCFHVLLVIQFYKKSTSLIRNTFYPNPAFHGFYLRLRNIQTKSLGVRVSMKNLSDLEKVVLVLFQIYSQTIVSNRQQNLPGCPAGFYRYP